FESVAVSLKRIEQLLAALDDKRYKIRRAAFRELADLGDLAEQALRQALKRKLSLEVRHRVEELLAALKEPEKLLLSPSRLRELGAIEVLEHIGTSEAREQLKRLVAGPRTARLTREAREALERLAQGRKRQKSE